MQGWIKRVIFCGLLMMFIGGCAAVGVSSGVKVLVQGANYTDDYINFTIYSVSGENLGIGGRVKKFSAGGTGGGVCCRVIPNSGGVIKVKWRVGDDAVLHEKDVIVFAKEAVDNDISYLIVRFFPQEELEAEIIDPNLGRNNPRQDKLFLGRKIMRHKGE